MDENSNENTYLTERIQQLEHERSQLRKDIEQLCMQQAGPGYLAVATKMHFQRTASLEQETENLKTRLAAYARDKSNLQEELSEAYRIKSQLADLHGAEVSTNIEAEKQLKFFQGCVAAAFSERDNSLMEAENAKEKEDLMSSKINDYQKRIEELMSDFLHERKLADQLRTELANKEILDKSVMEVVDKFYEIRQNSFEGNENISSISLQEKCESLLHDQVEMWSFSEDMNNSMSTYISTLEGELEALRKSMGSLWSKVQMGLEIENHLKKVYEQERKKNLSLHAIKSGISELRAYHSQHRDQIKNMLDAEKSYMRSIVNAYQEEIRTTNIWKQQLLEPPKRGLVLDDNECQDVHVTSDAEAASVSKSNAPCTSDKATDGINDTSKALALALQEKQEERHLLERNVNAALQQKIDDLQRSLLQVTNEKVKALMELARVKQENQVFYERIADLLEQGKHPGTTEERVVPSNEGGGKLKNLLKNTYIRQWIGPVVSPGKDTEPKLSTEANIPSTRPYNRMDYARFRVESATLRESMDSLEHLTSSIHRLRLALVMVKEILRDKSTENSVSAIIEDIITDAKTVKTALGSSLPVSWSAEADVDTLHETTSQDSPKDADDSNNEKLDTVSAAGFEMVELLLLASEIMQDKQHCTNLISPNQDTGEPVAGLVKWESEAKRKFCSQFGMVWRFCIAA